MSLQILTLKLDGITAGDYLAWCRDPDPTALGLALRSVHIDAAPLGNTITATLDWNQPVPPPPAAATAAGLPLLPGTQTHALMAPTAAAIDQASVEGRDGVIDLEPRSAGRLPGRRTIARRRPREAPADQRRRHDRDGYQGRPTAEPEPTRRHPTRPPIESPERTHVKHELALALTDLGGATFAPTYHGALNNDRLAPRVQRIHDLYTQLNALEHLTHTNHHTNEPVTAVAA
ncbi:MAG TPA: hypothetical protein VEF89_23530 [Solirubrobacteraceae bacterium]|nr:hypothetical protein [Solirubrobacteraceae bacterium]